MFICVCRAITEQQIQEAAGRGVSTLKDLRNELGLAMDCGSCGRSAKECLRKARSAMSCQTEEAAVALVAYGPPAHDNAFT
jgi:bacterioferritin-associated ferredoxin